MDLFESMFGFKLNEGTLGPSDLAKVASSGPYKGDQRISILINKIKNNQPLQLADSDETFLVHDPDGSKVSELENWDSTKGRVVLKDEDGNITTTSKLEKTDEFGGGSGSGGGSLNTDLQECAQCLVNALAFRVKGKEVDEKDLTKENLTKANSFISTTSSLEEMISFIESREDWTQPLVLTANKTLEILNNKEFQFHRGGAFVDRLYGAWNTARKKGNLGRMNENKWNPADIWAVDSSVLNTEFQTDLTKLNNQLIDLFKSNSLIGISLKKTPNPKAQIFNLEKQESPGTFNGEYKASPNSIDAYIYFTNGAYLQLRDFGSFQGEIKGKYAAGGKIGGGPLKMFLDKHNVGPIPTNAEAKAMAKKLDDSFVERFSYLLKTYSGLDYDREDMENKISEKFIISKYQALEVLDAFKTGNVEDVANASADILSYAGSQSSISSVFVKIS
jgi:hypothetical protein